MNNFDISIDLDLPTPGPNGKRKYFSQKYGFFFTITAALKFTKSTFKIDKR